MRYVLEQSQAQKLLDYLGQRPYAEVFELIAMIFEAGEKNEDLKKVTAVPGP